MYTYYQKINDEEHYLNATEIATLYNVLSSNNKPHTAFISLLLSEYYEQNPHIPRYYYNTNKGLMAVYPNEVYSIVIRKLFKEYKWQEKQQYISNNKKYTFILKPTEVSY